MIKVNLFNDKMSDIDRRVNEYVNENLKVMIEGFRIIYIWIMEKK